MCMGKIKGAILRDFGSLEAVALSPLDLVLPLQGQAFGWFDSARAEYSAHSAMILQESNTAYVGLIGIFWADLVVRPLRQQPTQEPGRRPWPRRRDALDHRLCCFPEGSTPCLAC